MDLIQNHAPSSQAFQKAFRVQRRPANARQFAVDILNVRQRLAEHGFPNAADSTEPNNGSFPPSLLDESLPETTLNHIRSGLHMVTLDASMVTFGSNADQDVR